MDCMSSLVKYILYLFNMIFVVLGILLIILGSIIMADLGDVKSFNQAIHTETIPIIIIVLGGVMFIVSFFGCCGAIRESNVCTMIYAVFMLILFCLQVALVVWIFVKRYSVLHAMYDLVEEAWQENTQGDGTPMDAIQLAFKCCGMVDSEDYLGYKIPMPASCCGFSSPSEACPVATAATMPGCQYQINKFWTSNMDIIRFGGIGVACVELIALIVACCLGSTFRRSQGHDF